MRTPAVLLFALIAAAASVGVAACSTDGTGAASTTTRGGILASSPVTVVEGTVAATAVAVGDCLSGIAVGTSEQAEIASVDKVSCFAPHEIEVFATFDLRAEDFDLDVVTDYPGRAPVVRRADIGCTERLHDLVEDAAAYGLLALWPSRTSWDAGDRSVVCTVFDPTGQSFRSPQFP